jgi:hypothetical protein
VDWYVSSHLRGSGNVDLYVTSHYQVVKRGPETERECIGKCALSGVQKDKKRLRTTMTSDLV